MRHPRTSLGLATLLLAGILLVGCAPDDLGDGFPEGFSPASAYHEAGWAKGRTHGQAFLEDTLSCALCHGEERDGGLSRVSCNRCHTGWETNCLFCHGGGPASTKGNPPYDTKGQNDPSLLSVGAHVAHVNNGPLHLAYDCTLCHQVPASLWAEGHLDDTPGAEVILSDRAGRGARYEAGTCSSVACHGGASVEWTGGALAGCVACHGDDTAPERMSGSHAAHFSEGLDCAACHQDTIRADRVFADRALHANGAVDVRLSVGVFDADDKTCLNTCHETRDWGSTIHPEGWRKGDAHGYAFLTGEGKTCADCHGADLAGGTSRKSCDSCHLGGGVAWRTDCTFCHGGTDNQTGAPPKAVGTTSDPERVIGAHTVHVTATAARHALDCTECHLAFESFDDPGHIDQGKTSRVVFNSEGLNPDAAYNAQTGTCSALYCHGNGRSAAGQATWTGTGLTCASCHSDETSTPITLSGRHSLHLRHGMDCVVCHQEVVNDDKEIIDPDRHINGEPDVAFERGTYDADTQRCSSTRCHSSTMKW